MKVTLHEIKKNLQGISSGGDEAENQINGLEHKAAKKNQSEQQEKKNKTKGKYKQPLGPLQEDEHSDHRGTGRRRESKKWKTYLKK